MLFTLVDWVIIGVIIFSTLISLWRGAAREILSLATWLTAGWVAFTYYQMIEPAFENYVEAPEIRMAIAFTILLITVLIIGALIAKAISAAISTVGLSGVDRILGMAFGFIRGVLILAILVMLSSYTELPSEEWWEDSLLIPHLEGVADRSMNWLADMGFDSFKLEPSTSSTTNDIIEGSSPSETGSN